MSDEVFPVRELAEYLEASLRDLAVAEGSPAA